MVKIKKLNNGLTLIIDNRKQSDFLTMAYMINKGSHDEPLDRLGIAHLVEHMVFKGTANRNKDEVWEDIQTVGGAMNAYTSETHTVFYATALAEHQDIIFDVLSDIVWNNTIPEDEFDLEKNVVIEELKMYQDDGQSRVFELLNANMYPNEKTRWYNGGTPETVKNISREQVIEFIENNYIPNNITLLVTGKINENQFIQDVEEYLTDYEFIDKSPNFREKSESITITECEDELDGSYQSHLLMYMPIIVENLHDMLCADILTDIIGGGFGSRLMIIREQYGYAYTVSCDFDFNKDEDSVMYVYAGLNLNNVEKTKEVVKEELEKLKNGIEDKEFDKAYNSFLTSVKKSDILCESATMTRIIRLIHGTDINTDTVIKEMQKITKEDIMEYIHTNIDVNNLGTALVKQTND